MTMRSFAGRRRRSGGGPRIGLFGLLGAGNIGNDASMMAVVSYLRTEHPDAVLDAMCPGPEKLKERYGINATSLYWHHAYEQDASGITAVLLKVTGKGVDAVKIACWVRQHDLVIVPGMGVLEASLPLRPWETPYAMFLLCASGRLFRTKVALVSVGANLIKPWATRCLSNAAARLASYRSYRDSGSREVMCQRGIDVTHDRVYPDIVFALPEPAYGPGDKSVVGIGVMEYHGTNDDRKQADGIHAAYVATLKQFARWLVGNGYRIRLFVGDTCDIRIADEIIDYLHACIPGLGSSRAVAEQMASFDDLTRAMAPAGYVIATRYHNVICALKLGRPVISLGYAAKNLAVMSDAGLGNFCQSANSLDAGRLIRQFHELAAKHAELRQTITSRNVENARLLRRQFEELSGMISPARPRGRLSASAVQLRSAIRESR